MKCPSCGFDSFRDTTHCRKCGRAFGVGEDEEELYEVFGSSAVQEAPDADVLSSPLEDSSPRIAKPDASSHFEDFPIHTPPLVEAEPMTSESVTDESAEPPDWKAELDQRVASFRRRRARTRGASDSSPNMEFDFEEPAQDENPRQEGTEEEEPVSFAPGIDIDLAGSPPATPESDGMASVELGSPRDSERIPEADDYYSSEEVRPVEFVLDHVPTHTALESGPEPVEIYLAPMGRRFGAGLIDAAVLAFSAGVFALIFWRAGGHVSSHPLTVLLFAFIAIFQVLVYFGAFTAIISTTPGLLWMGIEVRSIAGGPPTLRQAIWRAFGCLVSASAMLLGFVWALFDSENLTWHDRMSETYLAPADATAAHEA